MTQAPAPRRKTDRDEVFVEFTKSICPMCKTPVDAQVNIRESKVYLRKRCREHGEFEALVYGDAEESLSSARFSKPATDYLETRRTTIGSELTLNLYRLGHDPDVPRRSTSAAR